MRRGEERSIRAQTTMPEKEENKIEKETTKKCVCVCISSHFVFHYLARLLQLPTIFYSNRNLILSVEFIIPSSEDELCMKEGCVLLKLLSELCSCMQLYAIPKS